MNDLYNNWIGHWVVVVIAMTLLLVVVLTATAYTVWFERVALGRIQRRPGPNRVGPFGLLQLAADGIKLAFKESFVPAKTDKLIFVIAPTIGVAAAFLAWAVIPIGLWYNVQYWIADVNVGILVIFAVSSLNVYAIVIGGFATEYSGLKFTMYYLAEYLNVITVSALATLLFFGGWYLWIVPPVFAFLIKVVLMLFLYIWLRATFPRLRYDMLMRLGWKVLLPLAMANG